jgi:hypothetical protein
VNDAFVNYLLQRDTNVEAICLSRLRRTDIRPWKFACEMDAHSAESRCYPLPIRFSEPFSRPARTSISMTAIQEQPPPTHHPMDLASLVQRHQAAVWRYVRFLGADRSEADDLTQETFLALARSEFVERDERQTAGYLRVVARNQLLALRRKQNR